MSDHIIKLGILKLGCIGISPLLEFLLDERAEREDVELRVIGTGSSIATKLCKDVAKDLLNFKPDLAIVVSPIASLKGPTSARETLKENGIPTIVFSDYSAKKNIDNFEVNGFGYIIQETDSMIGARREFLDPVEMAIFNADIIRVLAVTGVYNLIVKSIDDVISSIKKGEKLILPRLVVDKEKAIEASGLLNPYARSKAMAAFEISKHVDGISKEASFLIKKWESYTKVAAAAHEMMRVASKLADEAREIEKSGDAVLRKPHARNGVIMHKTKLIEKPEK